MGDFNIDLLKYNYCNFSTEFFNQFSSSGYRPLISKPIRITKSTATLIDNIFTNNLSKTEHLNGILLNDISYHFPIFTTTEQFELQKHPKRSMAEDCTTRIITKNSLEGFCCKIKITVGNQRYLRMIRQSDIQLSLKSSLNYMITFSQ